MTATLLQTKLYRPTPRPDLVPRERLRKQLFAGLWTGQAFARKLTLIAAPAGFGKTTLIADFGFSILDFGRDPQSTIHNLKSSWLALDEADNDPVRFLRYLVAALQSALPDVGREAASLLELGAPASFEEVLAGIVNEIAAAACPIILTLDDYHVITHTGIEALLTFLLDHQPPNLHLIITSRSDPTLPLARLRARGQLLELRAHDLRFTEAEAAAFLTQTMGLTLLPEWIATLEQRTEGWIAGLQLAALSLQGRTDPAGFIQMFSGSHRYVIDYLAGEVLQQQGAELRAFLSQTSVLDCFNAELCNILTGRDDARTVIAQLEQAHLFIIPLDDERQWYRYHHLFADYLRNLLTQPEQTTLYQKAAAWHAANNLIPEAVRYALASGDHNFAADIIERALGLDATWSEGNLMQLAAWLEALPPVVIHSRPHLGLHAARVLYLRGRFEDAEAQLAQTEAGLQSQTTTHEHEVLLAMIALYRGAIAAVRGDFQQAIALIAPAQARIPRKNHLAHAHAFFSLGLAHEIADQIALAVENYLQSSAAARAAGIMFLDVHGLCAAAQLQIGQGQLTRATQTCHAALQLAEGARLPPLGLAWAILGVIAIERNDLSTAATYLQDGIALARQGGLLDDLLVGLAALGRLHAYQGDLAGMQAVIDEALSIIQAIGVPRGAQLARAHLARFQHFLGQHEAAVQWATAYRAARVAPLREFEELTLARILLSSNELALVPGILHSILERATVAGRMQTCLQAQLLLGLYHHAQGDAAAALTWLRQALELAAPEGYLRVFVDEGQSLLELLPQVRAQAPAFVDAVLKMVNAPSPPASALPHGEILSERELEILELLANGLSNQEIGQTLYIGVGTVKWYLNRLYVKLDVSNRTQAVTRAREWQLLP
ncbi:MAG: hypothetical protein JW892_10515 [Anaerolineae bacterium]|nr:hypothetical protein [Anaerolineae bacterium]